MIEYTKIPATLLISGKRGLERENLRLDADGQLSKRTHTEALGVSPNDPELTLDFAECQLELVTPPFNSIPELFKHLTDAQTDLIKKLNTEILWPHSMPPACAPEDVKIAYFGEDPESQTKQIYRMGLCHRYGKMMQTICGIHYNVSFSPDLFQKIGLNQSEAYFKIIRNFYRFYPILIYLFGASPFCHNVSFKKHIDHTRFLKQQGDVYFGQHATSLRQSELGYHNPYAADLSPCYNSLESYIRALEKATSSIYAPYTKIPLGQQLNANYLQIENEYYAPIRPKADPKIKARPLDALQQSGVEYIEIRLLDLNPLLPLGIDSPTLAFLDLFLLYCLLTPDQLNVNCKASKERALTIAKFGRTTPWILEEGLKILETLKPLVQHLNQPLYQQAWDVQFQKLNNPSKLPSAIILNNLQSE